MKPLRLIRLLRLLRIVKLVRASRILAAFEVKVCFGGRGRSSRGGAVAWRYNSGARHYRCARPLTPHPHTPPSYQVRNQLRLSDDLESGLAGGHHFPLDGGEYRAPASFYTSSPPSRSLLFSLTTAPLSRKSIWGLVATIEDGNHGRSWLATVAETKGWQHDDNAAKYLASLHFAVMTLTVRNQNNKCAPPAMRPPPPSLSPLPPCRPSATVTSRPPHGPSTSSVSSSCSSAAWCGRTLSAGSAPL